ncbi:MAG: hypothetical protein IPF48_10305 [Sphingomonadales bacterium]|nr:hypothetical protein [Sphingomonadales bacterium]
MPQAVHGQSWHVFRACPHPAHKDAASGSPYGVQQEGISAHKLHRVLEVQYKSAWFLAHRIREAMRSGALDQFGVGGTAVEVDETFLLRDPDREHKSGGASHKMKVLSLLDRETGRTRSMVLQNLRKERVRPS